MVNSAKDAVGCRGLNGAKSLQALAKKQKHKLCQTFIQKDTDIKNNCMVNSAKGSVGCKGFNGAKSL